jgi:hypothetical protein
VFRVLARLVSDPTTLNLAVTPHSDTVLSLHPLQLSRWLDEVWARGGLQSWPPILGAEEPTPLGAPGVADRLRLATGLLEDGLRSGLRPGPVGGAPATFDGPPPLGLDLVPLPWEHLVYAYLVESTGVVEVLTEVVRRYVTGESLDPPSVDTLVWLRTTEELFLRDAPQFAIGSVSSSVRPDAAVNRRNAYWRMFGCDLPHPLPGHPEGQAWKRAAGTAANTRFLEIWHELLRQVWLGIENDRNEVGANPTDPSYVAYLCQSLGEMFRLRRRGGLLAREEFAYVALASWFHLTVEFETSLVRDLRATTGGAGALGNAADRLALIGSRVGITPPRAAREMFELADLLSPLMWFIELGHFDDAARARLLFESFDAPDAPLVSMMTRVVDLWQSATGVVLKESTAVARAGGHRDVAPAASLRLPDGGGRAAGLGTAMSGVVPEPRQARNGTGILAGTR